MVFTRSCGKARWPLETLLIVVAAMGVLHYFYLLRGKRVLMEYLILCHFMSKRKAEKAVEREAIGVIVQWTGETVVV